MMCVVVEMEESAIARKCRMRPQPWLGDKHVANTILLGHAQGIGLGMAIYGT